MTKSSLLTCASPIVVILSIQGFLLSGRTTLHCLGGRRPPAGSLTACGCCPHRQGSPSLYLPHPVPRKWPLLVGRGIRPQWSPCSFPPLPLRSCVTSCFLQRLLDLADRLCHPEAGTDHPPPRALSWQMQAWLQA